MLMSRRAYIWEGLYSGEAYIQNIKVCFIYLIPVKIRAALNFAPLIFVHPKISRPFNFRAPLSYCQFTVFSFVRGIFLPPLIFAHSYCTNLIPLIFAQTRCPKIEETRILMGKRYIQGNLIK